MEKINITSNEIRQREILISSCARMKDALEEDLDTLLAEQASIDKPKEWWLGRKVYLKEYGVYGDIEYIYNDGVSVSFMNDIFHTSGNFKWREIRLFE
jgi:hypothetical protein